MRGAESKTNSEFNKDTIGGEASVPPYPSFQIAVPPVVPLEFNEGIMGGEASVSTTPRFRIAIPPIVPYLF